jgi:hypothetical protein
VRCSVSLAWRLARDRAARLDDGSNRQRPRRAAVAKPKRAADGPHAARLLRSLRGSDLRAGKGASPGCYRGHGQSRATAAADARPNVNAGLAAHEARDPSFANLETVVPSVVRRGSPIGGSVALCRKRGRPVSHVAVVVEVLAEWRALAAASKHGRHRP